MTIYRMTGINRKTNQMESINVSANSRIQAYALLGMTHRRMAITA